MRINLKFDCMMYELLFLPRNVMHLSLRKKNFFRFKLKLAEYIFFHLTQNHSVKPNLNLINVDQHL